MSLKERGQIKEQSSGILCVCDISTSSPAFTSSRTVLMEKKSSQSVASVIPADVSEDAYLEKLGYKQGICFPADLLPEAEILILCS